MISTSANGFQSLMDDQSFHEQMRSLYRKQSPLFDRKDGNDHLVQAKLPQDLYVDFWNLLKAKGWSKATGVKYAIYKLLNEKS